MATLVLHMPRPFKHPKTGVYYFRMRVPADLVGTVGKSEIKISLGTKDPSAAKELFSAKEQQVTKRWKALRNKPEPLPQKQIVALSGKVYRKIVEKFDEEPGSPQTWRDITALAERVATTGNLEQWYGPSVDELLLSEDTVADEESRQRLIRQVHHTLLLAAEQQYKKAEGDYSPDPNANRFPPLKPREAKAKAVTLTDLFKLWKRDHLADNGALGTPADFLQKIEDFKRHLGHEDAETITGLNVSEYCDTLRHERGLSAKTVNGKYLAAIRIVFRVGLAKSSYQK